VHQRFRQHAAALALFTEAMDVAARSPTQHTQPDQLAFVYFRRAWSHKALGDYTLAGNDFETARALQVRAAVSLVQPVGAVFT